MDEEKEKKEILLSLRMEFMTIHHEMSRLSPNFDLMFWCLLIVFFMLFAMVKTVFEYDD